MKSVVLSKNRKQNVTINLTREAQKRELMKLVGAWKETDFNDDELWKEVFRRKSRKEAIKF